MNKKKINKKTKIEERRGRPASEKAKKAIKEIIVGKLGVGPAMKKAGFSDAYSKNPHQFRRSKAYKDEVRPFLEKLLNERNRIIEAMEKKNLKKEQYFVLSNSLDKIVKNAELLAGRPTDNLNLIEVDEDQYRQLNRGR